MLTSHYVQFVTNYVSYHLAVKLNVKENKRQIQYYHNVCHEDLPLSVSHRNEFRNRKHIMLKYKTIKQEKTEMNKKKNT